MEPSLWCSGRFRASHRSSLLNRARAGVSPRSLLVLAWVAPIAGLICLVIAVIDIHQVATAGEQVQIGWGLWMVAICSAALCITAAVVAMQVGKLSEGSEAWTRTVITIAALVVLGGVVYFTTRPHRGLHPKHTTVAARHRNRHQHPNGDLRLPSTGTYDRPAWYTQTDHSRGRRRTRLFGVPRCTLRCQRLRDND